MASKLATFVAIVLALWAGIAISSPHSDPEHWLADFDHLKSEMSAGYANLEWIAEQEDVDLAMLAHTAEEKLRNTTSERKARTIISDFLDDIGDPHLRAEKSDPPQAAPQSTEEWRGPLKTASTKEALKAFGYRKGSYDFGIDFDKLDGFVLVSSKDSPFPAGTVRLDNGKTLGVIRIKYFGEDRYYKIAEPAWNDVQSEMKEERCGNACWWAFALNVRERLLSEMQTNVDMLQAAGIDALVVDVTGNGGGSEWAEDVARFFTTKELIKPPTYFVKHPHWEGRIVSEIERLKKDLTDNALPEDLKLMLEVSLKEHQELLQDIQSGCDRSAIWESSLAQTTCTQLAKDEHGKQSSEGLLSEVVSSLESESILFEFLRHPSFVGVYTGPLVVVVDGGSASATEQFATLLEFNEAATIVGEKTTGAGCGYTSGGIKVYLENTKLRVWMSDCLRIRADGENELAGLEQEIAGWNPGSKGKSRAKELVETLSALNHY